MVKCHNFWEESTPLLQMEAPLFDRPKVVARVLMSDHLPYDICNQKKKQQNTNQMHTLPSKTILLQLPGWLGGLSVKSRHLHALGQEARRNCVQRAILCAEDIVGQVLYTIIVSFARVS